MAPIKIQYDDKTHRSIVELFPHQTSPHKMAKPKNFSISYAEVLNKPLWVAATHLQGPTTTTPATPGAPADTWVPSSTSSRNLHDLGEPHKLLCRLGHGDNRDEETTNLRMELTLSALTSPFTFSGRFFGNDTRDSTATEDDDGSEFHIGGTGSIEVLEGGVEDFSLWFLVEDGTGMGKYTGISGAGIINMTFRKYKYENRVRWQGGSSGRGIFSFRSVNEAGASLVL